MDGSVGLPTCEIGMNIIGYFYELVKDIVGYFGLTPKAGYILKC